MNKSGIVIIYLAAGNSVRMKFNKLLLPLGGSFLGSWGLRAALNSIADHIFVVTKPADYLDWMDPSFFRAPLCNKWTQVQCANTSAGQSASLQSGISQACVFHPKGMIILLGDQPLLCTRIIDEIIKVYLSHQSLAYVAASHKHVIQPPVLFTSKLLPRLMKLTGDEGARKLLRNNALLNGKLIEYTNPAFFFDVDTVEQYSSIKKCIEERGERYGGDRKECHKERGV